MQKVNFLYLFFIITFFYSCGKETESTRDVTDAAKDICETEIEDIFHEETVNTDVVDINIPLEEFDGDAQIDEDTVGPLCTPEIHSTQGYHENIEIQRYRFVGGSPNGSAVAVLYSHFGPSSLAPFVNLLGYQKGSRTAIFNRGLFMLEGEEDELHLLEEQILKDGAQDMADAGIVPDKNLPKSLAWCQNSEQVFVQHESTKQYSWNTFTESCSTVESEILQWKLCEENDASSCVVGSLDPVWDCNASPGSTLSIALWDVFVAGDTIWIAAQRKIEYYTDLYFWEVTVASDELPY